jgi:hypothetical protein
MNTATATKFNNTNPFFLLDHIVTYQMICMATKTFCDVSDDSDAKLLLPTYEFSNDTKNFSTGFMC